MAGRYNGTTRDTLKAPLVPPDPNNAARWCHLGPIYNADTVAATVTIYLESERGDSVVFYKETLDPDVTLLWSRREYLEGHQHFTLALDAAKTTNQLNVHSCWE